MVSVQNIERKIQQNIAKQNAGNTVASNLHLSSDFFHILTILRSCDQTWPNSYTQSLRNSNTISLFTHKI